MLWKRGKAYSQDLRERVFAAFDAGSRVGEIAEALQVSVSYVSKALGRLRASGERSARPQRCHIPAKLAPLHEAIRAEVANRPDATLSELRGWLIETHKVSVSSARLHGTLAKLDLTLKKRPSTPRNSSARTSPRHVRSGARSSRAFLRVG
jgi:transposase